MRFDPPRLALASVLAAAVTAMASTAAAQGVGVSGSLGYAKPLANDQSKELGDGPVGQAGPQLWLTRGFALQLEGTLLGLGQGDPPTNPALAPRKAAGLVGAGLGIVGRPFASSYDGSVANPSGLFADLNGGAAFTGGLTRAAFDAHVGWDFWLSEGFGLGPSIGLMYVVQPNDTVRPDDAVIGLVALRGTYYPVKTDKAPPPASRVDRDADGIFDEDDKCPDDPEDKDGFEDADGCPDPDNDKDGILDEKDACPNEPEDKDGFQDEDGCPDPDNDADGVLDVRDKCPLVPEDFDGFEDDDGCPDEDNDKDKIPDVKDLCPNEAEDYNGYADEDGCPDAESIRVVGDQIVLDEKIFFHLQLAAIQPRSFGLLSRLAKLLLAHPEYKHISIEGHADETGTDDFNQKLSEARAGAVRDKLISYGVTASRLSAVGLGESRPAEEGHTQKAWQKNRRVEFRITRETRVIDRTDAKPKGGSR